VVWSSEQLVLRDDLNGSTVGQASGVTYGQGKDGQAVEFSSPSAGIEYPAKDFPVRAGRVEFDMMFPKPVPSGPKSWCLLSDVGAGGAFQGAFILMFREGNSRLELGIWDNNDFRWCYSKTGNWEAGRWYHISVQYGTGGMKMEVDGQLEDTNTCIAGLANTPKRLGYHDAWMDSPPAMVDNFKTYRFNMDGLSTSSSIASPKGFGLFDNYSIDYELASDSRMSLGIYAKSGLLVKSFIDNKQEKSGLHTINWDGKGIEGGTYDLRFTIKRDTGMKDFKRPLFVNTRWKWKKVGPQFKKFFPTGIYFFNEDDMEYLNRYIEDPVQARKYYETAIKDNAEHGINLLIIGPPKDHLKMALDIAAKYHVKAIVPLESVRLTLGSEEAFYSQNLMDTVWNSIKDIKDHPALLGYYLIDEPSDSAEMANRISTVKKILEAMDPKHPGFSCLLGGYENLFKTVDYQTLLIDIYHIYVGWSGDLSSYESEVDRGIRAAGDKPLWVIPQVFGKPNVWLIPTPAELRAQVWLALAHGAKGMVYFIYQSTTGVQGEWLQGLVDMQLKPMDQRLDEMGKINADIKKLAPVLLKLKPADFPVDISNDKIVARGFTDKRVKYVILANKDIKNPQTVKWNGKLATNVLTGKPVTSDFTLEAGAGVLLRL